MIPIEQSQQWTLAQWRHVATEHGLTVLSRTEGDYGGWGDLLTVQVRAHTGVRYTVAIGEVVSVDVGDGTIRVYKTIKEAFEAIGRYA
jgi:hypothetical protein